MLSQQDLTRLSLTTCSRFVKNVVTDFLTWDQSSVKLGSWIFLHHHKVNQGLQCYCLTALTLCKDSL